MRKVVDSSMLQSPELRRYLSASRSNYAVLPDFVSIEAYKIGSVERILERWQVVSDFPQQVVVLKGTSRVCVLRGRGRGLQQRLIDHEQTARFSEFCAGLKLVRAGDPRYARALMKHGAAAQEEADRLLATVPGMLQGRRALTDDYSEHERRAIRAGTVLPTSLSEKFAKNVMTLAALLARNYPVKVSFPKSFDEFRNLYLFRFALCSHIWLMEWVADGSMEGSNAKRVRNDMVDLTIAAYGTYFDGIMTADGKLAQLYWRARAVLEVM